MAIIVSTDQSRQLLAEIKAAIDAGTVKTWTYDTDGDFTHYSDEWRRKAWLRPRIEEERLLLRVLAPRGTALSRAAYAVYHARFIEMLLRHFDTKFSRVVATALPAHGDIVKS